MPCLSESSYSGAIGEAHTSFHQATVIGCQPSSVYAWGMSGRCTVLSVGSTVAVDATLGLWPLWVPRGLGGGPGGISLNLHCESRTSTRVLTSRNLPTCLSRVAIRYGGSSNRS